MASSLRTRPNKLSVLLVGDLTEELWKQGITIMMPRDLSDPLMPIDAFEHGRGALRSVGERRLIRLAIKNAKEAWPSKEALLPIASQPMPGVLLDATQWQALMQLGFKKP